MSEDAAVVVEVGILGRDRELQTIDTSIGRAAQAVARC
jgi:hypothetical protein